MEKSQLLTRISHGSRMQATERRPCHASGARYTVCVCVSVPVPVFCNYLVFSTFSLNYGNWVFFLFFI